MNYISSARFVRVNSQLKRAYIRRLTCIQTFLSILSLLSLLDLFHRHEFLRLPLELALDIENLTIGRAKYSSHFSRTKSLYLKLFNSRVSLHARYTYIHKTVCRYKIVCVL